MDDGGHFLVWTECSGQEAGRRLTLRGGRALGGMDIRLIIGLGNPDRKYAATRHNIGFWVADVLAGMLSAEPLPSTSTAHLARGTLDGESLLLAKPVTYMNRSGRAARALCEAEDLTSEQILVVCDDTNLPLSQLRVRRAGSHGGHNGLRSMMEVLGTDCFGRVRCGVGEPQGRGVDLEDWVLSEFRRNEMEAAEEMARRAAEAVLCVCREGYETAMSRFNQKIQEA